MDKGIAGPRETPMRIRKLESVWSSQWLTVWATNDLDSEVTFQVPADEVDTWKPGAKVRVTVEVVEDES